MPTGIFLFLYAQPTDSLILKILGATNSNICWRYFWTRRSASYIYKELQVQLSILFKENIQTGTDCKRFLAAFISMH